MYTSFFGLAEKPFAITPDPRYLFLSERHAEALAHLLYGIEDAGGFVQLTGEVGTGKTTTVRSLLAQVPDHADVALVLNPRVTPLEFLLAIVDELHVPHSDSMRGSPKALVDCLNIYLLDAHAHGRRVVVIVDEAQQLPTDTLEQVRLLTNLETETRKLLQIILVGQPELRDLLARNDLRQLAQRITGRYHLDPLTEPETAAYVRHRLKVAGSTSEVFSSGALKELHRLAGGIPRVINVLADRALLGAFTIEQHRVSAKLVRDAANEVFGRTIAPSWMRWAAIGATAVGAMALLATAWVLVAPRLGFGGATRDAASTAAPAIAANGLDSNSRDSSGASGGPTTGSGAANGVGPNGTAGTNGAMRNGNAGAATGASNVAPTGTAARSGGAPATLAALLATGGANTGTDPAFAKLFSLWGTPFEAAGARPCEQASAQGLECLAQRGTLAQLRMLNRPAIVSLVTPDGTEHQVVISQLRDSSARLELGTAAYETDLNELQRYWYGDFLILWRPPITMARALTPGMRGADVRWLRQGLQQIRGETPRTGASDVYDRDLVKLVEDFQRTHRLTVDGIAGQQTVVMLDAQLAAPGSPTLRASGG
jgi:general secretion pathway protein A